MGGRWKWLSIVTCPVVSFGVSGVEPYYQLVIQSTIAIKILFKITITDGELKGILTS